MDVKLFVVTTSVWVNLEILRRKSSDSFPGFFLFLEVDATNYLLCCVHLDARFPVFLIQPASRRGNGSPPKRPDFTQEIVRGKLGGCNFDGPPRRFHPRGWMSVDENRPSFRPLARLTAPPVRKSLTLGVGRGAWRGMARAKSTCARPNRLSHFCSLRCPQSRQPRTG